ncbi:hypothetical protein V7S43_010647 [Phytophthora oleae]|uniref:Sugar transporter SWEET1 n=1 Tax=Phytophthora oleae TaxID=2107226 RepID=A0ABD3FBQ4_9STRA
MSSSLIVVKVFTISTTVLMRFSLVPDFVRMGKQRSTGDMSVVPPVMLFTNCFTLSLYSYEIRDIVPLFVTSVLGVIVGGILTSLFFVWTVHKRETATVIALAVLLCTLVAVYGSLAMTGIAQQSHSSVSTTLGFITIGTTILLYGSPMATVVRVLRTRTASSMPFTMGVVNVMNSLAWILYSSMIGNMFILAPNIGGIILGTTQMVLTYMYSEKRQTGADILSVSIENEREVSIVVQSSDREAGNGAVFTVLLLCIHQVVKVRKAFKATS